MQIERTPERLERGKYLAWHVFQCMECHSRRDFSLFAAPPIAGTEGAGGAVLNSSNITPHETGIKSWTKEIFVAKFKQYQDSSYVPAPVEMGKDFQTIMPWMTYSGMTEEDLGAIFTYLQSLDPVDNAVEKFVVLNE